MNKLYLTFFFNIVWITLLRWISYRGNEVFHLNKYLNIMYNDGSTWKLRNNRLLKNDGPKSEIGENSTSDNTTLPGEKNILKDINGSSEIHEKLKKDTENSMHAYIKKLERGYTNKKGLKRLDCHYEKKLFEEMYKLDNISGHMKNKNSYFKKVILKRYGLRFFIFSLVILFGIVTSIFSCFPSGAGTCKVVSGNNPTVPCDFCSGIGNVLYIPNSIIYLPLIIAYLSFIIYILSKVKKYKGLKRKYGNIREV